MFETYEPYTTIINDKLYFLCASENFKPPSSNKYLCFTTDNTLVYTAFFADFGPLNLGLTYQFCVTLDSHLKSAQASDKVVVYYCADHPHRRSNSATLIVAYLIFVLNYTVEQAYAPFIGIDPPFTPFRDAAFSINTYPITVLDCARAFYRVVHCGHFNFKTFSLNNFVNMAKLENGDFSWIVPGKFIAFSGPLARRRDLANGKTTLSPEEYVPRFKELGVTCIIRFNNKCYDKNVFTRSGIRHVDLFYEDGGNPTDAILQSFLQICERESGAIAVHCKAGLGRTGTNIAAYMMKHWGYTAKESTAWCRVCRPGSVVGPQQQYLSSVEAAVRRIPANAPEKVVAVAGVSLSTGVGAGAGDGGRHRATSPTQTAEVRQLSPDRSRQSEDLVNESEKNGLRSRTPTAAAHHRPTVSQSTDRDRERAGSVSSSTSRNRRVSMPGASGDTVLPSGVSPGHVTEEKTSLFSRGNAALLASSSGSKGVSYSSATSSSSRPHTSGARTGGGVTADVGTRANGRVAASPIRYRELVDADRDRDRLATVSRSSNSPIQSQTQTQTQGHASTLPSSRYANHGENVSSLAGHTAHAVGSAFTREREAQSREQRPKTSTNGAASGAVAASPVRFGARSSSPSSRPISSRFNSRSRF